MNVLTVILALSTLCAQPQGEGSPYPRSRAELPAGSTTSTDTLLPQFHPGDSCGAWSRSIAVLDTAEGDMGIARVYPAEALPGGVIFSFGQTLSPGDTAAYVRLELAEGIDAAEVVLVAEDVAGNADSMIVRLERRPPEFIDPTISLLEVGRRETRAYRLRVTHGSRSGSIRVERLRFRDGRYFSVPNLFPGGYTEVPIVSGDTVGFDVRLTQGLAREYYDTLVVTVDCIDYEIPIHATIGTPLLAVANVDFWQVLIGREVCAELAVWNPGTDTVYISAIEVGGGEYRFDTAAIPFLPDRIGPGDTIHVPICFLPRKLGLLLGTVAFISSAADTVSVVAKLVGIGVNSFVSSGFDDEGRELQITVVPQHHFLTVVSGDRSLDLDHFQLYNLRGQEVEISAIELIGEGWWQIRLDGGLNVGMYYLQATGEGAPPLSVKFVVLE